MATSPKRFVTSGQVTRDIAASFTAGTDPGLAVVRDKLNRPSVCDFKAQLISALAVSSLTSLPHAITTHVRDNSGDTTLLKSAERFYMNAAALPIKNSTQAFKRTTSQLTQPIALTTQRNMVRDQATMPKAYTRVGNVLTFTRPARLMIICSMNWGTFSGLGAYDDTPLEPSWRFASTGNNRTVSASVNLALTGSLSQGLLTRNVPLQSNVFYEEEIVPSSIRPLTSTIVLDVLSAQNNTGGMSNPFGRIEHLAFELERSPYVVSYGTQVDHIGFFKTTAAGLDDARNFIEVIEL